MAKQLENSLALSSQPDPSFFQSSCTGTGINVEGGKAGEMVVQAAETKKFPSENGEPKVSDGFTCCVPLCFNYSKRNRNLQFCTFPSGSKPEKILLRKSGFHLLAVKGLTQR